ncbi:LptF/LptG family permease [Pseudofulvibacter geojedonensis]|uniref:LptF/LptG family permease n=1 Tax=Pseudofulvibacter geojedonensis TaxID=1123758 RepID=A0ABW3HY97_9FLAO
MLKTLDKYILKRYLGTFITMLLLFVPIGIIVNLSEKIDNLIESKAPFDEIVYYYACFVVNLGYLLFPLFLFLSVIWFTSKLANKTEIIAILSSGISYTRFLRPYLIGATLVAIIFFVIGLFILPKANKGFYDFKYTYLRSKSKVLKTSDIFRQLTDNDFIYASSSNPSLNEAYNFTLEHFDGNVLKYKIEASRIKFKEKDSLGNNIYKLTSYIKRNIGVDGDSIERKVRKELIMNFDIEDLTPVNYMAETLGYNELNDFIEREKSKGSADVNRYLVAKYKRWSTPVAAFILTIIAVAVSSMKRRGGMGVNLAIGIAIAFIFVFFDKIFSVMAEQSGFNPLLAVWLPNMCFAFIAVYLLNNAKR